jgi:hypothetical protein
MVWVIIKIVLFSKLAIPQKKLRLFQMALL